MRKPRADVPEEVGASDDEPDTRTQRKRTDSKENDGLGDEAEIQILREFVDGLKSKGLSRERLQTLIAKINDEYFTGLSHTMPIEEGYALGNDAWDGLDEDLGRVAGRFNKLLDDVMQELAASPELEDALRTHDLFRKCASIAKNAEIDPVAAEIAREVKIKWGDHKKPPHRGLPWTKNASTFIEHIFGKWVKNGTLCRAHLMYEPKLYRAYAALIANNPDWDLNLPKEDREFIDDPEKVLERRRRRDRIRKQISRNPAR